MRIISEVKNPPPAEPVKSEQMKASETLASPETDDGLGLSGRKTDAGHCGDGDFEFGPNSPGIMEISAEEMDNCSIATGDTYTIR
jgi:hypothetical protein